MSQLSITLLRLGFLVLLWLLVLSSIGVLRADLYGTRVTARGRGRKAHTAPDATAEKTAPARTPVAPLVGAAVFSAVASGAVRALRPRPRAVTRVP